MPLGRVQPRRITFQPDCIFPRNFFFLSGVESVSVSVAIIFHLSFLSSTDIQGVPELGVSDFRIERVKKCGTNVGLETLFFHDLNTFCLRENLVIRYRLKLQIVLSKRVA